MSEPQNTTDQPQDTNEQSEQLASSPDTPDQDTERNELSSEAQAQEDSNAEKDAPKTFPSLRDVPEELIPFFALLVRCKQDNTNNLMQRKMDSAVSQFTGMYDRHQAVESAQDILSLTVANQAIEGIGIALMEDYESGALQQVADQVIKHRRKLMEEDRLKAESAASEDAPMSPADESSKDHEVRAAQAGNSIEGEDHDWDEQVDIDDIIEEVEDQELPEAG